MTSPPYLWQREYLHAGHPASAGEVGREQSIDDYVAALVEVFRGVRRCLSDDGTLWLNLGDGHANDHKWGGATGGRHQKGLHGAQAGRQRRTTGLPPKCLMGLPWRVAFALVEDGWTLRCDIVWDTNAMPEGNVRDRPTISHEYLFLFSSGPRYFYDIDAIREQHLSVPQRRTVARSPRSRPGQPAQTYSSSGPRDQRGVDGHELGRNARSVWYIPTDRGDGQHAAPMPRDLARRCVLAGSAVGDEVLDPFGGPGTVGLVAEQEGRNATLIDIDERACAVAGARTAQTSMAQLER
ncbi:DNA-methyltransferase [Nannocystis pusilla]|uniref:DNA-methyltransferase n=1 Tax=Nannocystis pusilla TaxID=889268 RepID=UPI003B7A1BD0